MHTPQEPTTDEYGAEIHPAFGSIRAARVTSHPGKVLFQSDLRHQNYVVLTISTATRKRDLNHDWVHARQVDYEVAMSEAQWASFVSSMNTSGVPCTITARPDDYDVPGVPFQPRTAESVKEVRESVDKAMEHIRECMDAYVAHKTVGNLRSLQAAIESAPSNAAFAADSLTAHVENVVNRARADIEAIVTHKAGQLQLDPAQFTGALALEAGEEGTGDG